jgi:hypothetical protein
MDGASAEAAVAPQQVPTTTAAAIPMSLFDMSPSSVHGLPLNLPLIDIAHQSMDVQSRLKRRKRPSAVNTIEAMHPRQ